MPNRSAPIIGITTDADDARLFCRFPYVDAVIRAGATPLLMPAPSDPSPNTIDAMLAAVAGVILTGGDDPATEPFGEPSHPSATLISPRRQRFETLLLDRLVERPELPVLGICLGMQMMALHAGGRLDQHLPDHGERYAIHWGRQQHTVGGALGDGVVTSHHRQAVIDPGHLEVVATAPDGIVEAIRDSRRPFALGVQWHPEITADARFGAGVLKSLVDAARG